MNHNVSPYLSALYSDIEEVHRSRCSKFKDPPSSNTHARTKTNRSTDTDTHGHIDTWAHMDTQTHKHTDIDTRTQTHTQIQTHRHWHTDTDTQRQTHRYRHTDFHICNILENFLTTFKIALIGRHFLILRSFWVILRFNLRLWYFVGTKFNMISWVNEIKGIL